MINARFVPVAEWPGRAKPSSQRKRGVFRVKYFARLDVLEKELNLPAFSRLVVY